MLASRLCLRGAARPCLSPAVLHATGFASLSPIPWRTRRVFATTPRHRKDSARIPTAQQIATEQKQAAEESVKPEDVKAQKPAEAATKHDPLLAEQTVTNKEQRKADWAIIKDMAHYLWPKDDFGTRFRVGLSLALLVGAKVRLISPPPSRSLFVDRNLRRSLTSKSPSTSNPSSTP